MPIRLNVSATLEAQQPALGRVVAGVKRQRSSVVVFAVPGMGQ